MVRLLRDGLRDSAWDCRTFQSHYGAIATSSPPECPLPGDMFQSHYGAIATCGDGVVCPHMPEVSIPLWCDCYHTRCRAPTPPLERFNPTMVRLLPAFPFQASTHTTSVSIPLWCDCYGLEVQVVAFQGECFNPTMVRLLPFGFNVHHHLLYQFQSHYGAIATDVAFFNVSELPTVSIPLWCDCYSAR